MSRGCLLLLSLLTSCGSSAVESAPPFAPTPPALCSTPAMPAASVAAAWTSTRTESERATPEADSASRDVRPLPSEFPDRQAVEALDRLPATINVARQPQQDVITLRSDDLFGAGDALLSAAASSRLDAIAEALAAQVGREIVVRGHTDALGDHAESTALSQRRAEALRDYFITMGVSAEHIRAEGYGPERPVADNTTAYGRTENRRIEIVIAKPHRGT